MKNVVHIIRADKKFTRGYMKFMLQDFDSIHHDFIMVGSDEVDISGLSSVVRIDSYRALPSMPLLREKADNAEKIIISMMPPYSVLPIAFLPRDIIKKTWFQLWGGEYEKDEASFGIDHDLYTSLKKRIWGECAGCGFLIDGEYEIFVKKIGMEVRHQLLPMPQDPQTDNDLSRYIRYSPNEVPRILVGHSGYPSLRHEKVFDILKRHPGIEVVCPLSYGSERYIKQILGIGRDILGDRFVPVTEFMPYERYLELLSSCDAAIFYTNTQQALGNIYLSLALGVKMFLLPDTILWKHFSSLGFTVHSVLDLADASIENIVVYPSEERAHNIEGSRAFWRDPNSSARAAWRGFFSDDLN